MATIVAYVTVNLLWLDNEGDGGPCGSCGDMCFGDVKSLCVAAEREPTVSDAEITLCSSCSELLKDIQDADVC